MKRWQTKAAVAALLGSVAGLTFTLPAFGQNQEAPESLLPEGFADPVPAPEEGASVAVPQPSAETPPAGAAPDPALTPEEAEEEEKAEEDLEVPQWARRPIDRVGVLAAGEGGLAGDAFGRADGRFLATLMRRLDAPLASRWASILLRRALLSRVGTPTAIAPPDWVAARAGLLLRMGEADAAKLLIQAVDVDRYSPRMFQAAAEAALATADPAAFCPLTAQGEALSSQPIWPLAAAICAGLSGEAGTAAALIDRARHKKVARGIDLLLAEKVIGAGTNSRRAVNIQWDGVGQLTSWRFGMASAVAVPVPEELYATVGPHVRAWQARAALLPLASRIAPMRVGATLGVFSNASLVDAVSQLADESGQLDDRESAGALLRNAYVGPADARMRALRTLWGQGADPQARYADAILTARAAARIAPSAEYAADSDALVGAMLSAGLDTYAARWSAVIDDADSSAVDRAWAMLAVGAPRVAVDTSRGRVGRFIDRAGSDGVLRARMVVAALAGLGRLSTSDAAELSEGVEMRLGGANPWTRALALAAARGQAGSVALIAAAGLQSRSWSDIPPLHLYHIVAALRRVGHEAEARMIAAEAIQRL